MCDAQCIYLEIPKCSIVNHFYRLSIIWNSYPVLNKLYDLNLQSSIIFGRNITKAFYIGVCKIKSTWGSHKLKQAQNRLAHAKVVCM